MHTSHSRLRLAVAVVVPFLCVLIATARRAHVVSPTNTHTSDSRDDWTSTEGLPGSGALARSILERLGSMELPAEWPGSEGDLARDVEFVVVSLASDDSSDYFRHRTEQGLVLNAVQVRALINQYARWGLASPLADEDVGDDALLRELWASNSSRLLRIRAIDPDDATVSTLAEIELATPTWPYEGIRSCRSVFVRGSGAFGREEGDALINSGKGVLVQIGVEFGDGSRGHLALRYLWDGATRMWCPVSISVGSESAITWPWPAF